jgi:hypothetical protein
MPAEANFFYSQQIPCVRIFLKPFPLRRSSAAQQDTFLQAAANFLQDDQLPWVSSLDLHTALQLDAGPCAASSVL